MTVHTVARNPAEIQHGAKQIADEMRPQKVTPSMINRYKRREPRVQKNLLFVKLIITLIHSDADNNEDRQPDIR